MDFKPPRGLPFGQNYRALCEYVDMVAPARTKYTGAMKRCLRDIVRAVLAEEASYDNDWLEDTVVL